MGMETSDLGPRGDKSELKILNRWLVVLTVAIILWAAGVIIYVDKRISPVNHPLPIIMVDVNTGKVVDPAYTNLFHDSVIGQLAKEVSIADIKEPSNATKPLFEHKDTYNVKDFVVVNYFYVEGIIVEKSGNNYTVMYKDHNHVLQKLTISKEFLLSPTSQNSVSPVALLVD